MPDHSRVPNVSTKISALTLFALVVTAANIGHRQIDQTGPSGIEAIFEDGTLLQDRNGDGIIDYVNGHVVLGNSPSDRDVAAAANVGARLGFETSAMNLPLTRGTEGIAIAVGEGALTTLGIHPNRLGVDLEPGLGVADRP